MSTEKIVNSDSAKDSGISHSLETTETTSSLQTVETAEDTDLPEWLKAVSPDILGFHFFCLGEDFSFLP